MADFASLVQQQAGECRRLGSPFTARVLDLVPDLIDPQSALGRRLGGQIAPEDKMPLRLAGALHGVARAGDPDLAPVYPPHVASDAALRAALGRALTRAAATILPRLDHPPQTNEVARSAVLIAAGNWLTARFRLPLVLSELGSSAGVNLLWDHYGLDLPDRRLGPSDPVLTLAPDWRGDLPPAAQPQVLDRAGVDLAPLDAVDDRERLLSFIWPDQEARLQRCGAALDLVARLRPDIARDDAAAWGERRLAARHPGALHLVWHTVVASYFSPATAARWQAALTAAGGRATADSPLAHLAMEEDATGPGAALTLTLWPGGQAIAVGRADFHGRWVEWRLP